MIRTSSLSVKPAGEADGTPTLYGRLKRPPGGLHGQPHLTLRVWCPECCRHHLHGFALPPSSWAKVNHRIAHCHPVPRPHRRGYFIAPVSEGKDGEHNRRIIEEVGAYLDRQGKEGV